MSKGEMKMQNIFLCCKPHLAKHYNLLDVKRKMPIIDQLSILSDSWIIISIFIFSNIFQSANSADTCGTQPTPAVIFQLCFHLNQMISLQLAMVSQQGLEVMKKIFKLPLCSSHFLLYFTLDGCSWGRAGSQRTRHDVLHQMCFVP